MSQVRPDTASNLLRVFVTSLFLNDISGYNHISNGQTQFTQKTSKYKVTYIYVYLNIRIVLRAKYKHD